MKKTLALLICIITVFTLSFSASAASPITATGGSDSASVKATFVDSPDVYSVDIAWGAMTNTYTQTWSTATRTNNYAWASTASGTANKVTVTNSSNVAVTATYTYVADSTITGVTGIFSPTTSSLAIPAGTATTGSSTLTLAGTPSTQSLSDSTVGSVTVTITKQP